jgi:hypothetical protein
MVVYLMAAKDSVTGVMYSWTSQNEPDFTGIAYPGPNDPTEIQQRGRNGVPEGGGGSGGTNGANLTNAAETLTVAQGNIREVLAGTLSANRTKTLSNVGAIAGDWIEIINNSPTYSMPVVDISDSQIIYTVAAGKRGTFTFGSLVWAVTDQGDA